MILKIHFKIAIVLSMIFIFLINIIIFTFPSELFAEKIEQPPYEVSVIAASALIMDYDSGKILWEKNAEESLYPASTTKMLTVIMAIESIDNFNEIVTVSPNAAGRNHSVISFKAGDKVSLMDLVKMALIASNNNATNVLAEYISGDIDTFVMQMNMKAKQIGANNTNFENTHGLDSNYPGHKTTAKDLAVIARYCMENDLFKRIAQTKYDVITINEKEIEIYNTNELLSFEYIIGGKTGFTNNAGLCIVLYSSKNDLDLITVVLNSTSRGRRADSLKLINWAYHNFYYKEIVSADNLYANGRTNGFTKTEFDLYAASNYSMLYDSSNDVVEYKIIVNENIQLPVEANKAYGAIEVYVNNKLKEKIDLIAKEEIKDVAISEVAIEKNLIKNNLNILIYIFAFYFLIIIIIIFRNLFIIKKHYQ